MKTTGIDWPDESWEEEVGPTLLQLLGKDIRANLRKCNAPVHWDDNELGLLIQFALFPSAFDVVEITRKKHGPLYQISGWGSTASPDQMVLNALHLAKMFAEAREELLKALPRIVSRIRRYWRNPKKRIELELALAREFGWSPPPQLRQLWTAKAAKVAEECNQAWQPGRTLAEKLVECDALHLEEMPPESRNQFLASLPAKVRAALTKEFGQDQLASKGFWQEPERRHRAYRLMRETLRGEDVTPTLAEDLSRVLPRLGEMSSEKRDRFLAGMPTVVRAALAKKFSKDQLASDRFWQEPKNTKKVNRVVHKVLLKGPKRPARRGRKRFTEDVIDKVRRDLRKYSAE